MNNSTKQRPIILRTIFALAVIAVFVASMFPFQEKDFYVTLSELLADPQDATMVKVIELAKEKQSTDKVKYAYPSVALESAARDIKVPDADGNGSYPVDIVRYVKPVIIKQHKLQNNSDVIALVRKNSASALHLGIDLHGGAEFLLHLIPDEKAKSDFSRFRDNAIETLRKRLAKQNIFEAEISPAGLEYVSVRVPVKTEDEKANLEKLVLRSAKLEFRFVHDMNDQLVPKYEAYLANGGDPDAFPETPSEAEFLSIEERVGEHLSIQYVLVETAVQMEGNEVKDAYPSMNQFGKREILFSFTNAGAKQFGEITGNNIGRRLAVVLDGQLYSAPTIQSQITTSGQITGSFSQDEAQSVSDALVSGSLPFEITVASRSDIDATVGADTIRRSIISGIVGCILVMVFMLIYYKTAGLVANIALIVNSFVLLGALAAFGVTLTLPGIAGIILTLGMAIDANVLFYERIREEQDAGKSLHSAVTIGFDRAFSAIFDSNLTTLFTGIILYWQGTGSIKGFAMTLVIGIFTTMFSAVFLSRVIFEWILRIPNLKMQKINMLMFLPHPKIDFVGKRYIGFGISAFLILLSLITIAVRGSSALSIDFTGGTQLMVNYEPEDKSAPVIPASEISKYLGTKGYDAKVAYKKVTDAQNAEGASMVEIVVRPQKGATTDKEGVTKDITDKLIANLDEAYPQVKFTKVSESTLGALIGAAFTKSAIIALVCAMLGMIAYMTIRFQFSYSIAANIALLHDIIVATGIYLLCGGQISLQVVASLLTLIGYSVNDTIVIFDRQRENLQLHPEMNYFQIVNLSMNQTLGRTILTSICVMLVLLCQFFFGGDGIHDFVATIMIGNIAGCYSSIFVSPMITAYWHRSSKKKEAAAPAAPAPAPAE